MMITTKQLKDIRAFYEMVGMQKEGLYGDSRPGYIKILDELRLDDLRREQPIIVKVRIGDLVCNQLLTYTNTDGFQWMNKWWGGSDDIELLGAMYLEDVKIEGNKLEYRRGRK